MEFLRQSFQEHSVIWLLISAGVGGLIGALIKFVFETVIASHYESRLNSQKMLRQFRYPLLRAADSLDRRLENLIHFVDQKWYDDPDDDYYRLSTLYLFGCYLGWAKILEDAAYLEFEGSNTSARNFSIRFNRVFKALSGYWYFKSVSKDEMKDIDSATVPRFALTAIGELMQKSAGKKDADSLPKVLGFVEFSKQLSTSNDFKKWFKYLESGILLNQQPSSKSAHWNRLLVVATQLRAFLTFLDPSGRQTAPRQIEYLKRMHPAVAEKVKMELLEMGLNDSLK